MSELEDMKINALVPWFGGKRTLGETIATELGQHTQYFEPFCGSMAVLFAKKPSQKETVNDLHGDLVNLARCLQRIDQAEELYDRLARVVLCEDSVCVPLWVPVVAMGAPPAVAATMKSLAVGETT